MAKGKWNYSSQDNSVWVQPTFGSLVDDHRGIAHQRITLGSFEASGGEHLVVAPIAQMVPDEDGRQQKGEELQIHGDY